MPHETARLEAEHQAAQDAAQNAFADAHGEALALLLRLCQDGDYRFLPEEREAINALARYGGMGGVL